MLKSMLSFGITENLQISASLPVATTSGTLPGARMMSLMSNERELEVLTGYRFQRRVVGVGGRQESTVYAGGTVPLESTRGGVQASPSLYLGAATGYASRSHYVWVGGGVQHFTERHGDQLGAGRFASVVYGFRPKPLRVEAHKPDARRVCRGDGRGPGGGPCGRRSTADGGPVRVRRPHDPDSV